MQTVHQKNYGVDHREKRKLYQKVQNEEKGQKEK